MDGAGDPAADGASYGGRWTTGSVRVRVPAAAAFRACTDPVALATWRVPDAMTGEVHEFDARVGGRYRMSLTYSTEDHAVPGKSGRHTDTFTGTFVELVPGERIVEVVEFETDDPGLTGPMTVTTTFVDHDGTTEVTVRHDHLPAGIRPEDNELGTRQSLAALRAYLEG
jgi:uncharacterized protein YndB with AHSA1/START domain